MTGAAHRRSDTLFLTIAGAPVPGVILPRLARLEARPGCGEIVITAAARVAPEWRASTTAGIRAAQRLADSGHLDVHLTVPGSAALEGPSAGLPVGLAALALLLDRPLPLHRATGAVLDEDGFLAGGASARAKSVAVAGSPERPTPFVVPPIDPFSVDGVSLIPSPDLATGFRSLDPDGYARIEARHAQLRTIKQDSPLLVACALEHAAEVQDSFPDAHVVAGPPQWLAVARHGRLIWRGPMWGIDAATLVRRAIACNLPPRFDAGKGLHP